MANIRKLVALAVAAALAIVAAGYFLLVSPKNAEAADLETQAAKETSTQDGLRQQIAMLTSDERHEAAYQAQLTSLKVHMPDQTDEPSFLREVVTAADSANVRLNDITPGAPTAPSAQSVAPKPVATAAAGDAGATPAASSAVPAAAAPVDPSLGLSVIPVSLHISGTYSEVEDFLLRLTRLHRAFLVQNVQLSIAASVAPATAAGAAAPVTQTYSGRLDAAITGSVFSAGAPGVIGTI
ncbi:MAG: hypothetical protein JWR83_3004, partial [Aeromicrobium sp.]|nr:hypothetical protein [Aeromicrobium sp.]